MNYIEKVSEEDKKIFGFGCAAFSLILSFIIGLIILVSAWTDRNLDFWATHINGKETDVPMWISVLITIFGSGVILIVNIIAEIAKYFI